MRHVRLATTSLLAIVLVALVACSGAAAPTPAQLDSLNGPGPVSPGPADTFAESTDGGDDVLPDESVDPFAPAQPHSTAVPDGLVDPCKLASVEELSTLAGTGLSQAVRSPDEDGTFVECDFFRPDQQDVPELSVTLWPWDSLWQDEYNSDIAQGGGYEALSGIGSIAEVFATASADEPSDGSGRKGGIWFNVSTSGGGNGRPSGQDQAVALLRLVASRLP